MARLRVLLRGVSAVKFGLVLIYLTVPVVIRRWLVLPRSKVLNLYCALFDTLCYGPVLVHLLLMVVVLVGFAKAYWFTFLLLDIVTMSPLLQATLLSVTRPINQLAQTFALFVIVICCYTSVGFYLFGSANFVDGDDDSAEQACSTLAECFLFSLYVGLREGDMDAILDDADRSDAKAWRNRIIYDLTFFVILGVLLFDVVTGIILDTFGELREEVNVRKDKIENESFVSGLSRDQVEEMNLEGVDFRRINDRDQNVWSYVLFVIYVKSLNASDMNGVESYVRERIDEEDATWFPQKTCWAMENAAAAADAGGGGPPRQGGEQLRSSEGGDNDKGEGIEEGAGDIKGVILEEIRMIREAIHLRPER